VKLCSVCSKIIIGPIAVAELSTTEGGLGRLERSLLCPECVEWARTFLRPTPVAQPGEAGLTAPGPLTYEGTCGIGNGSRL
jgi:hypothetical protein